MMRNRIGTPGRRVLRSFLGIGLVCFFGGAAPGTEESALTPETGEEDILRFWQASGVKERLEVARVFSEGSRSYEEWEALLHRGPRFRDDVPRGRILRSRVGAGGKTHPWLLLVPENYRPEQPLPLRVELHGGMGAKAWPQDGSWARGWKPQRDAMVLLPAGWWDSMWWTAGQVENLAAILDEIKRTWNVDENRVLLVGASDGCIGSCFFAFRQPTPFAGFGGSVGCPVRLTNPTLRVDGQMHLSNLLGTRFFLVNGGRDPLFPMRDVRAYWDLFRKFGAEVEFLEYPRQGHSFSLTREDDRRFARFLFETRRDPLPDQLSWATERTDRYSRRSWLDILELGARGSDSPKFPKEIVMPRICTGKYRRLRAPKVREWGRVDLNREGNRVEATTRGVKRFRLLLSRSEFDLTRPIEIFVNGGLVFYGRVQLDKECLLRWAAKDLDRVQLFAGELEIEVP